MALGGELGYINDVLMMVAPVAIGREGWLACMYTIIAWRADLGNRVFPGHDAWAS